jgi:hypothetical protein
MKPSRTCERSKREGVRAEPDDNRFAELGSLKGRETSGEEPYNTDDGSPPPEKRAAPDRGL